MRRLEETEFGKRMKDLLGEMVQALPGASVAGMQLRSQRARKDRQKEKKLS